MSVTGNAAKFGIAASRKWWSDGREMTVSFDRPLEDQIVAWIKLNCRDEVAQTVPSIEFYYSLMSKAFLTMYDSEIVNPIHPVTDLGQEFIDQIRRATGIGAQSLPTPKPALTPAQELEAEVRSDWVTLSSKQIRTKMQSNRIYRECLDRLAPELESSITQHVTIPELEMSARKSKERETKKNARLHQGKVLAGLVPAPAPATTPALENSSTPNLSPRDKLLWDEIQLITVQVQKLLQQASAKIVARALIEGMKEARTSK